MSKLVIGLAAFVLLAAGGALAGGALTDSTSDTGTTTNETTTAGTTTNEITTTGTTTGTTPGAEDVRGPCDEAEHANDSQCTRTAPAEREGRHNGNRGRDDDREHDDDRNDDRSGPNRGPG